MSKPESEPESRSEKYRDFAEQCMDMAGSASDQRTRAVLVQMAQVWFRLAEEREERTVKDPAG